MEMVILVIHVILAAAIIGVVLLQPPESGALGGLGGSNPMAGPAGRSQGNLLTRTTAILATAFIITSLVLAILAGHDPEPASILDQADNTPAITEKTAPAEAAPTAPAEAPSVPLTQ